MNPHKNVLVITLIGVVFNLWILWLVYGSSFKIQGVAKDPNSKDEVIVTKELPHGDDKLLIPQDETLSKLSQDELIWMYWWYANSIQIVCSKQMRHGYGFGKEVCLDKEYVPQKPCLVYSIGSMLNFEFELAILRAYDCEVHVFDPSTGKTQAEKATPERVHYHFIGLDGRDYVNGENWTMRSLPSIVKELNHENRTIDILKIDAEGAEWRGFQDMANFKPLENVKQLLVEFHFGILGENKLWGDTSLMNQIRVLRRLHEFGFRIFMRLKETGRVDRLSSVYGIEPYQQNELSLINTKFLTEKKIKQACF